MSKILIEIPNDVNYENYDMPYFVLDAITSGKHIPNNATNGDMIMAMFPHTKVRNSYYTYGVEVKLEYHSQYDTGLLFDKKWWNAEYKEPTTKVDCDNIDCNNCVNHKYCDYESNKPEIPTDSTTKIVVTDDWISRQAELPPVASQPAKNDAVDCISRKAVFEVIDDCNSDGLEGIFCSYDDGERFKEYIKNLSPVTPQEPRKGYWILTDVEDNRVWHCHCSECGKDPQDYIGGSEN